MKLARSLLVAYRSRKPSRATVIGAAALLLAGLTASFAACSSQPDEDGSRDGLNQDMTRLPYMTNTELK